MARFVYRLQKVFELREQKKKEQERRVQKAKERVRQVEEAIIAKKNEIRAVRQSMFTGSHMLIETADIYLEKLNEELEQLYYQLQVAQQQLEYEMQMLIKAQAELEALIKHKEKAEEEWKEEEKRIEMKMLDEIAGQRYFRTMAEKAAEDMAETE